MMRICIDAHMIGERETGNERYTFCLIEALLALDSPHEYQLLSSHPLTLASHLDLCDNASIIPVWPAANSLRILIAMPWIAGRIGAALLHVNYIAPPWCPCPTVVTVHDISFSLFPSFFSLRDRLVLSMLVPFTMRHAERIIAVSEWTKQDITVQYGIPESKIVVVYEAPAGQFHPITNRDELARVRGKYGIAGPFILALGNLQPRKNIARLVSAYAQVRGLDGPTVQLVIAGQALWRESNIYDAVVRHGLEEDVIFTGYVPETDLPALYSAADVFVFPSLYEGFGLPPLEAMSCGTPVISSNAASLPEVVGNAALTVLPTDIDALTDSIQRVLTDEDLRRGLRSSGLERVRQFTWQKAARQTLRVYEDLVR